MSDVWLVASETPGQESALLEWIWMSTIWEIGVVLCELYYVSVIRLCSFMKCRDLAKELTA